MGHTKKAPWEISLEGGGRIWSDEDGGRSKNCLCR